MKIETRTDINNFEKERTYLEDSYYPILRLTMKLQ